MRRGRSRRGYARRNPGHRGKAGDKAYFDTFAGLVPCKVLSVSGNEVTFKLTANRGAYKRGEVFTRPKSSVVPREAVFVKRGTGGSQRIRPYEWNPRRGRRNPSILGIPGKWLLVGAVGAIGAYWWFGRQAVTGADSAAGTPSRSLTGGRVPTIEPLRDQVQEIPTQSPLDSLQSAWNQVANRLPQVGPIFGTRK